MLPSLQSLTKKVLARQCLPEDQHYLLKCYDLWWNNAPITFDHNLRLIKLAGIQEGLDLNMALVKAVKENNYSLIKLFTEWGANINYGLISVNTEHTWDLCRELGAKKTLNEGDILQIFIDLKFYKTSSNIILCHEVFSDNLLLKRVNNLKMRIEIFWELRGIIEKTDLLNNEFSLNTLLLKYWYAIAVRYNLKEAIQYFYQKYTHLNTWRLTCALCFNNVFDLHEAYEKDKICMDLEEMMRIACIKDHNLSTIYYCYMLGANINQAMLTSIQYYNIENIFFCMDLGADAFEEGMALVGQEGYEPIRNILSLKIYSPATTPLPKSTDPEIIDHALKNYFSKNMMVFLTYDLR
ncbi:pMGF360-10L [Recombinant African swine fever virus]|nr:pMGF360-10L [Recombinant African swine fever virus]WEG42073.1 MGF 360-12L [African swine fever virus]CAK8178797.1 p360-10L [African swine fever virus]CAK8179513.1 p360-10L [African swine fever virus]CAK8179675.1 p360-10L [African swine fever virus]